MGSRMRSHGTGSRSRLGRRADITRQPLRLPLRWAMAWCVVIATTAAVPTEMSSLNWFVNVVAFPAGTVALPMLARGVSRDLSLPPRAQRAWRILAVSWLALFLETLCAAVAQLAAPVAELANAAASLVSLVAAGLALWALQAMPSSPIAGVARVRTIVDQAMMFLGMVVLLWLPLAVSNSSERSHRGAEVLATMAFPALEAAMLVAVWGLISRERNMQLSRPLRRVGFGLAALVSAQIASDPSGVLAGHIGVAARAALVLFAAALGAFALSTSSRTSRRADLADLLPRARSSGLLVYLVPLASVATALIVIATRPVRPTDRVVLSLASVVLLTGVAAGLVLLGRDAKRLTVELHHHAYSDPLTGAANRRYLEEVAGAAGAVYGDALGIALLLVDLDKFKEVNDTFGHEAGDELLRMVVDACQRTVRKQDVVARVGGDEFAIFMPRTTEAEARGIALRIADGVRNLPWALGAATDPAPSASVGVAIGSAAWPLRTLMRKADADLYSMKRHAHERWKSPSSVLARASALMEPNGCDRDRNAEGG